MTKTGNRPKRKVNNPFKKGNQLAKGHGFGRPKLPADIKAARQYNNSEFERVCNKYLETKKADLEELLASKTLSIFEEMHINMMLKAREGDVDRYELLMNRLLGRPKGESLLEGTNHSVIVQILNNYGNKKPN